MTPYETFELPNGATCTVKLNGAQNVVLLFRDAEVSEPFAWGFADIREFRQFVKAVNRFDDALGAQE